MDRQRRLFSLTSLLLLLLVIVSACGNSQNQGNGKQPTAGNGMIETLNAGAFGGGSNPQLNYHPFSATSLIPINAGYIYEPLMVQNTYSCNVVPWLATAYKWQDPKTLNFTIRDGVKWSDGQAFSADDVVFTLNLLHKAPALDTNGLWTSLNTVSAQGNQVTLKFKGPSVPMFEKVIKQDIVARHIWEKISDPVKYIDEKPVGTGPFLADSFNQEQMSLKRNPSYWQADKIKVNHLVFHKVGSDQVENLKLARGEYDWNAMFVPNVDKAYVARDPKNNHYWFPAGGEISLGMNLTKAPYNDVEFRRAMAYAINRDQISQKAEFGYVKPASQSGLSVPGQESFLPGSIPNKGIFSFDQKQALDILTKAGYKKDSNGKLLGKDGKPIDITFLVQNGWTDWIQAAQVIQSNLNTLGLTVNVQTPSPEIVESRRAAANYDMVFSVHGGSCSMYENYEYLDSRVANTVNYIHHKNPDVDKMRDQLQQAVDPAAQKKVVAQLAQYSYEQFPDVPLWYGANWFEFSTKKAVGWPDANTPYAKPGDVLLILTHLRQNASNSTGK
ncbi:peptide ABC transporter substrate-binding protein [Dictyobacter alpinus]|uniref:Peptide ABC transporter substrate-binding protein n=1 Tax=Dictyobacter alpinus TaxID=2014873 RepID=A0A402BIJ8_9CHLR|nr:ABC transporter substrate-binding protein [Dictyobacter alpinus]GCE31228.1 peptide ABC transporter substrate-binding protein [Dictyobacter alpinus]